MMTVKQAAEALGCSSRHVQQLIAAGKLKADKVSPRFYLVDKRSVDAYARKTFTRGWKRGRPRKPAEGESAAEPEQPASES